MIWNRLQRQAQNAFGFSPTEANGFLALLGLLAVLVVGPLAVQSFWPSPTLPPNPTDAALLDQAVAAIQLEQRPQAEAEVDKPATRDFSPGPEQVALRPFPFDPNQLTEEQWKKLGLKPWLAQRIVKYRSRGGKFRIKADLKKIYGFPELAYDQLQAYIQLPESLEKGWLNGQDQVVASARSAPPAPEGERAHAPAPVRGRPAPASFDLNQADTAQLRAVRGIGPVLAERIIKFRRGLGGFHSLDQLQEVYGLPPEARQALLEVATLPPAPAINGLAINQADVNTLKTHPYLGYNLAQVIVNYRQQHGPFATPDDLLKTQVIDAEKLAKLRPYLKFE
ncbi:MAG: helix-hairpin-helix domain-containing protein [Bernardetiaceae bacterium]|nr:helix-hairpin-helix domain-containing protein [Bernardetiaceae bacterium]